MLDLPKPRAAAWAPWSSDRDWLQKRDEIATAWLSAQARIAGTDTVLQVHSHADDHRRGDGPIAKLARNGKVATYKSPAGSGARFVDHADIRLLATAVGDADGQAVAATENPTFPLYGWAMATGAINLATGEVTPDERTPEQIKLIEHLENQLYNGWSHKEVGRRATAHVLPQLVESGMTYPVFVGSIIALDPRHLDNNSDIADMHKALPPTWASQREELSNSWRRFL
jgi:hypothetical protein